MYAPSQSHKKHVNVMHIIQHCNKKKCILQHLKTATIFYIKCSTKDKSWLWIFSDNTYIEICMDKFQNIASTMQK